MDYSFLGFKNQPIVRERYPEKSLTQDSDPPWELTVRSAQFRDLKSLADILTTSFHSSEGWLTGWLYPFLSFGIYEDLRSRFRGASPHYHCFTAILVPGCSAIASNPTPTGLQEEITGTVEIALRSLPSGGNSPQYPYISNLAVSPNFRRRGIGRQLLLSCEPIALEWGFKEIYLHVLENNDQAKQLYWSLGYRIKRIESGCFFGLFQQPRRLLLQKSLR
ncbi:GNAT family N-acetyltransferase [Spirulina subsalsa FACHB-351]|uniref:GNAT family N-acetyltransferase n=1 Tax=Spirulina subsalsa FACHB-351 TaxID=234711 RepID=A0ABT3L0F7_9CYAN|nr:GNAT family N-acetyltransferase [Spirulina subsalsa]MCW6034988.1 GNAT family N-acetyltransferase [Spirulina subsalsa FACHB-351]